MTEIGYTLSSEEFGPEELVSQAARAEEAGFTFALISDHFHPWTDRQGHSPFVWATLGAIAQATERIRVGTGVTCPTVRIHPAIVAQAAATVSRLMPGRFFLGVGTGEKLNEHITGAPWLPAAERREMLSEALIVIKTLWAGGLQSHTGRYFTVEDARIYTLPDEPPPIYVAAAGEHSATMAALLGDGLISTAPNSSVVDTYRSAGGDGPRYGQLHVCYADDEALARKIAHAVWPNVAIPGELGQELPLPRHFEQAAKLVTEDDVAEQIPCGPDATRHKEMIQKYIDAGFDHVYVHQIGDDQRSFFRFYEREILPAFS